MKELDDESVKIASEELKDSNHVHYLAENLYKLQKLNVLCDITLFCDKQQVNAHKIVLAACSEYFEAMFTTNLCESQKQEITLKCVNVEALNLLIKYSYTGILLLNETNVQTVLETADLLQFFSAKHLCCEYIKERLTVDNCLDIFQFAVLFNCEDVVNVTQNVFNKNWKKLITSASFKSLQLDILVNLISTDSLNTNKESNILVMILKWLQSDIKSRLEYFSRLLSYVRWSYIEPADLKMIIDSELSSSENVKIFDAIKPFVSIQYFGKSKFLMRKSYENWLYVLGGEQSFLKELKSCEFFSHRDAVWDYGFSLHGPRTSFAAVVNAGKLYVIGGLRFGEKLKIVERFDSKKSRWKRLAPLRRCQGGVKAAVVDDIVYVAGGSSDRESACRYVEKYDESNNQWQTVSSMQSKRRRFGMCSFKSKLYVFGGFDDNHGEVKACEVYDPESNLWSGIAPLSTTRCDLGVAVLSDCIYVAGGMNSCTGSLSTVERYNATNNTWSTRRSMLQARAGHAMTTYFGKIIAIGGTNGYMQTCKDAEWYDEINDKWTNIPSINMPRFGSVAVVLPFCKRPLLRERDETFDKTDK